MNYKIETASGGVLGTKHARAGRNYQDALHVIHSDRALIAVVCDGCSSGDDANSHNEVGAQFGARLVANAIEWEVRQYGEVDWKFVRRRVVEELQKFVSVLRATDDERQVVLDYLLFTTIAIVVTDSLTEIAAVGDGVVIVNGAPVALKEVLKGAPDYLAYTLTTRASRPVDFNIVARLPTSELENFFIGTDGCNDLAAMADAFIPGTTTPVGPLSQFWTDDRFYGKDHEDALRRWLVLANGGVWKPRAAGGVWKWPGALGDDTTCFTGRVVRAAPAPEAPAPAAVTL